jgi:hypothetical protein
MDDNSGSLEAVEIGDKWVWVYTSPGGACHQGPRHYRRRADAQRAGKQWLQVRGSQG